MSDRRELTELLVAHRDESLDAIGHAVHRALVCPPADGSRDDAAPRLDRVD